MLFISDLCVHFIIFFHVYFILTVFALIQIRKRYTPAHEAPLEMTSHHFLSWEMERGRRSLLGWVTMVSPPRLTADLNSNLPPFVSNAHIPTIQSVLDVGDQVPPHIFSHYRSYFARIYVMVRKNEKPSPYAVCNKSMIKQSWRNYKMAHEN